MDKMDQETWILPWVCSQTVVPGIKYSYKNIGSTSVQFVYRTGRASHLTCNNLLTVFYSGDKALELHPSRPGGDGAICPGHVVIEAGPHKKTSFDFPESGVLFQPGLNNPHHFSAHQEGDRLRASIFFKQPQKGNCCHPYVLVKKPADLCGMNSADYEYRAWFDAIDKTPSSEGMNETTTWLIPGINECSFNAFNNSYDTTSPPSFTNPPVVPVDLTDAVRERLSSDGIWMGAGLGVFIFLLSISLVYKAKRRTRYTEVPVSIPSV